MKLFIGVSAGIFACFAFLVVAENKPPSDLKVGDKAPDFAVGKDLKLSDLQGKKNVLVAFFPKPFTPGCTKQLCGYRDDMARFQSAKTDIVAISTDSQAENDRFKTEEKYPFHLVGDPDAKIIAEYGVPLKEIMGKRVATRSVFLVDKTGVIRYIDLSYDVVKGVAPLNEALRSITN